MAGLSYPERARLAFHYFDMSETERNSPPCLVYLHNDALSFIMHKRDPNYPEWEAMKEILKLSGLLYGVTHPSPPPERILEGDSMAITLDVVTAANNFLQWIDTDKSSRKRNHVLVLPGALLCAPWDSAKNRVVPQVCFAVEGEHLGHSELLKQAEFATMLIDRVGRTMNVIINGQLVQDVIANTSPKRLLREYSQAIGDEDKQIIPDLVRQMSREARARADAWDAWLASPGSLLLPEDVDVLSASNGILACDDQSGHVTVHADDPDDMPEDILVLIREILEEN